VPVSRRSPESGNTSQAERQGSLPETIAVKLHFVKRAFHIRSPRHFTNQATRASFYDRRMEWLLERDDEIAILATAREAARSGHGSVIFISGEAGSGKSSLVQALSERVDRQTAALGRRLPVLHR